MGVLQNLHYARAGLVLQQPPSALLAKKTIWARVQLLPPVLFQTPQLYLQPSVLIMPATQQVLMIAFAGMSAAIPKPDSTAGRPTVCAWKRPSLLFPLQTRAIPLESQKSPKTLASAVRELMRSTAPRTSIAR